MGKWARTGCGWLAAVVMAGALAQERPGMVTFQRVPVPDEVPAQLSSALAQDAQGFLWIGTQSGLVRYDGYQFKTYRAQAGDPHSLGGSYVRSLLPAHDGRLWVGTISGGLSVLDPRTEQFTQYRHAAGIPDSLVQDRVEAIAEAPDGQLWLGTNAGVERLDPASGRFQHIAIGGREIRAVLVSRNGAVWAGTRDGLWRWNGKDAFSAVAMAGDDISKLFEDSRGRIWIGTANHGAAVFTPGTAALQLLPPVGQPGGVLSHFWVHGFAEVAGGEIWIATFGSGIDVVDGDKLTVLDHLRSDTASTATIGSDRIGALLTDRTGLVWVGSWGGGIARHDPATRAFRKWRYLGHGEDGLSHAEVVRVLETRDGMLWLGTNGNGIDVLDRSGHRRRSFRPDPRQAHALSHGAISCLAEGPDGSVWAATLDGKLHRQRPGQNGFEQVPGMPGGPVRSIVFGPDGSLWAGALNGLAHLRKDGKVQLFGSVPGELDSLSANAVESLAFTADGTLWVGTESGLNALDPATGLAHRILHDANFGDSLPDNWVPDMLVDRKGRLWVLTQAGPAILQRWDGQRARFDALAPRLGLPGLPTESLVEDAAGQIWLGARVRINPSSWRWRSFGPADGNDFHTLFIASRMRARDGALLFGSPEGMLMLQPSELRNWTDAPPVAVTALRIDGREQPGANALTELVLQAQQRDLRLEFAAFDSSAPAALSYRYRLDGYDRDWVYVEARQRVAAYTGLAPGQYLLHIEGSNRNGVWSGKEWRLPLTVLPAFWQTWWFRLLMGMLGLLVLYGAYRLRVDQLRRRGIELERVVAERTADLAAAYQRIEEASLRDPLTQLHNRRFLEQALVADLELVARRHSPAMPVEDADLVLLMLDLDHFKQVNDVYGHAAGDAVLTQTASVLTACLRASDYVVRWGGEEFLLVARFIDRTQGHVLAEKIRRAIADHDFILPDGRVLKKTVSIGYAAWPYVPGHPADSNIDIIQRVADVALYAAKKSWRNAWVGVMGALDVEDADAAVERFLADPAASVAAGDMIVSQSVHDTRPLVWS